jgi:hypothetical protein
MRTKVGAIHPSSDLELLFTGSSNRVERASVEATRRFSGVPRSSPGLARAESPRFVSVQQTLTSSATVLSHALHVVGETRGG